MDLNQLLADSEDRRRFFMRSSVIPSRPDTRPRDRVKRRRVLALEMEIIKDKVDMSKFSRPSQEVIDSWRFLSDLR